MAKWTREKIIRAAKRAAAESGGQLGIMRFCRLFRISRKPIYRLFPGRWKEVCELAGIDRQRTVKVFITDDQLLQEFHRVACEVGTIPSLGCFAALARLGKNRLRRRFGSRQATLQRYGDWLKKNHPDSPLLQSLIRDAQDEWLSGAPQWAKVNAAVFGAPINFRSLLYAPTNEQGVIYLFGMVSSELGLKVEAIHPAYPDCEAKRCIDSRHHRWQSVRIEFEFASSKFRDHRHDPSGCDLIVCWEHDWPDCPLEVVELRSVIGRLKQ